MRGEFRSGKFLFRVEDVDKSSLRKPLDDDDDEIEFEERLANKGTLPKLSGAPIASWLLARVGHLTDRGIPLDGTAQVDGGGWMCDFAVYMEDGKRLVAAFQLQANMDGPGVVGDRSARCSSEDVLDALASAIMAKPNELATCQLSIVDPEWMDSPRAFVPQPDEKSHNVYGWDGSRFLGRENIRERSLRDDD